jgi:hypothetical protein
MSFTLFHKGVLRSNASLREKHQLRRHFHEQLRELLQRRAFEAFKRFLDNRLQHPFHLYKPKEIGPFHFMPFITEGLGNVARLEVTLLFPEEIGRVMTQSGDLDNRVKTLLDALRCPKDQNEILREQPQQDEDPFYCLLEDDSLVVDLSVAADRLLLPGENVSQAVVLVRVTPDSTATILGQRSTLLE